MGDGWLVAVVVVVVVVGWGGATCRIMGQVDA